MKPVFDMSGIERAAALLVAMGPRVAADIMKHLDEESIEKLSVEIAKIDRLTPQEKEDLIGEFLIDLKKEKKKIQAGQGAAREILTRTFGADKAGEILDRFSDIDIDREFSDLNEMEDDLLLLFLAAESPQAIAVVLSFLAPAKSAVILKGLDRDRAKEVALRMARMDRVVPDAVAGIVKTLKKKYREHRQKNQGLSAGGLNTLVDIIKHMPAGDEKQIMEVLDADLPAVSQQIREKVYSFENVIQLGNNEIRILIDEIGDDRVIAKALKGAGDEIRFKFLRNMSQNRATDILHDMDAMGPVRLTEVEECRGRIVNIMRALDDSGIIRLGDGSDAWVK